MKRMLKIHSAEDAQIPTASEMKLALQSHGWDVVAGYTCFQMGCPFCEEAEKKLYVNMTSGFHICKCQKFQGPWRHLQDSISVAKRENISLDADENVTKYQDDVERRKEELDEGITRWMESSEFSQLEQRTNGAFKKLFQIEALSDIALNKLNVKVCKKDKKLFLPLHNHEMKISAIKVLEMKKVTRSKQVNLEEATYPRLNPDGLFGYQLLDPNAEAVVLTVNEFDAVAIHQKLQTSVLSLPRGLLTLPQEILPMLEHFKKIFLWFGNDVRSWEAARKFSKKLSSKRCHLIRPLDELPAPLQALNMNIDLRSILKKAQPVAHRSIVSFQNIREEVFRELTDTDQVAGVKWQRFPQLCNMLKGHRKGELTVFTGPTGSGKTTFISEYSLDLCMQGVNTLWGSFEIKNVRLAKIMLRQLSQLNIEKNMEVFDLWADKIELLPLYFLDFHGQQGIKAVVEAMTHAVYVHDIEHVIVDNLQFMVGTSDRNINDRFAVYDAIIATFRTFATRNNCHVTVVIHPRKEKDSDELQTASIFGSAKASQEADNILILQDRRLTSLRGKKYIQVAKNRFDGDLGIVPLFFDKDSLCMSAPPKTRTKKSPKLKKDDNESQVLGAKPVSLTDIFIENDKLAE
ncbi:twinkle protein, mitochondrial-like isoform X2 [Anneissia japonica]|nr:twinkle protein, mitochondrial-like isoform X2 [Anneissia japonica]XP_033095572.1 twinkle protein, mitochondrial-like isoform X2 [Anneissia japonica]